MRKFKTARGRFDCRHGGERRTEHETSRVTVTDQHGRLLNSGSQDPVSQLVVKRKELERSKEQDCEKKLTLCLSLFGFATTPCKLILKWTLVQSKQTRKHDPNTPSTRSDIRVRRLQQRQHGGWCSGIDNQPPADASIPQDVAQNER